MGITVKHPEMEADALTGASQSPVQSSARSFTTGPHLRRTISLIRGSCHRLSLFEIRAEKIPANTLVRVVQSQFDREAEVDIAEAGNGATAIWLMFIRTGGGDRVLEARVQATLSAALCEAEMDMLGLRVQAVHRDARTTSDLDDMTEELRAVRTETPAGIFH